MAAKRLPNYRAFWPFYVREHRRPETRMLHFVGTSAAIALIVLAAVLGEPWLLLPAVVSGYFFAWTAHFFVERNRPATFTYPLYSLIGDFHMYGLMWFGRMNAVAARHTAEAPDERVTAP